MATVRQNHDSDRRAIFGRTPHSLRLWDLANRDPGAVESWSRRRSETRHEVIRVDPPQPELPAPFLIPSQPTQNERIVRPEAIGLVREGRPSGVWTFFNAAGGKDCEGRYEQGRRVGLWIFWYASGVIDSLGEYVDDLEEGPWTSFHSNGRVEEEGHYRGGHKIGIWTYLTSSGDRTLRDHGRD